MCLAAAVGFLAMSSVITMSAPFFLGRIIDVIYTDPTVDYSSNLTRLCLALSGVFLCGAAANAVRVYLMQTSGKSPHLNSGSDHPRGQAGDAAAACAAGPRVPFLPVPCPVGTGPHIGPDAML